MTLKDLALFCLEVVGDYLSTYQRSREWLHGLNSGYSRDYLSNTLKKEGWIDVSGGDFRLLDSGRRRLKSEFPLLEWRKKKWDGKWRVVIYDIPERRRVLRDKLRKWLKRFGFGQWQISVWVSPRPVGQAADEFFKKIGLGEFCGVYESKRLFGRDDRELAKSIWRLDELNERYAKMLNSLEAKRSKEYLEILAQDPMLPKELLPDDWLWDTLMKKTLELF